ncbi:heterokaryon incompatibility protein-domain-containing protein [Stachybotrys elegans]|uniref:Heterokaryon incompatibility protein-domain-containing protein n=1 Tax=Stachybotrys elegans TaxID=80388 RepID=A0A8K0SDN8_9HYPO|nr:heterokaryon incompatibility protein-domain-containing protein [Stachybotrys elegans]
MTLLLNRFFHKFLCFRLMSRPIARSKRFLKQSIGFWRSKACPICKTPCSKAWPNLSALRPYTYFELPSTTFSFKGEITRCALCAIVFTVLDHAFEDIGGAYAHHLSAVQVNTKPKGDCFILSIRYELGSGGDAGELAVYLNGPDIHTFKLVSYKPVPLGSPEEVLNIAAKLQSNCVENHARCAMVTTPEKLQFPLRLIDVSQDPPRLKEYQPEQNYNHPSYIALSHRWASSQPLQTLHNNIGNYRLGIPLHLLSPTIQDAIRVCQRFEISFLWIDSLCIIQDNDKDWEEQSSQMWMVYANAKLVIAAARDMSDEKGFLGPRKPFTDVQLTANRYIKRQGGLPLVYRLIEPHYTNSSSIESRGWTLQESLSAKQYLIFGTSEVHWSCRSSNECECGAAQDNTDPKWRWLPPDSCAPVNPHAEWRQSVTALYPTRNLTKPEDVLVAISGIARQFHARFGGNYLAGLWQDDLLYELAWSVKTTLASTRNCYMPSWTWASVVGGTMPDFATLLGTTMITTFVTVVDAWTRLTNNDNPFGHVTDASITLQGVAVKVRAKLAERGTSLSIGYSGLGNIINVSTVLAFLSEQGRMRIRLDTRLVFQRPHDSEQDLTVRRARYNETAGIVDLDEEGEFFVWIIPLFIAPKMHDKSIETHMTGLVVTPSETRGGNFERIGVCSQVDFHNHIERGHFERFMNHEAKEEIILI